LDAIAKNMKNLFKICLIIIILAIIGGAFYWYEWRPSQIRKSCQEKIEKQDKELFADVVKSRIMGAKEGDVYDFCLRKSGLEK